MIDVKRENMSETDCVATRERLLKTAGPAWGGVVVELVFGYMKCEVKVVPPV